MVTEQERNINTIHGRPVEDMDPDSVFSLEMFQEVLYGSELGEIVHQYAVGKVFGNTVAKTHQRYIEWVLNEEWVDDPQARAWAEPIHTSYWNHRAAWFYIVIGRMNQKNIEEAARIIKKA